MAVAVNEEFIIKRFEAPAAGTEGTRDDEGAKSLPGSGGIARLT